ncbi:hypothetical protein ACNKHV_27060 [Shigella flexneri]
MRTSSPSFDLSLKLELGQHIVDNGGPVFFSLLAMAIARTIAVAWRINLVSSSTDHIEILRLIVSPAMSCREVMRYG